MNWDEKLNAYIDRNQAELLRILSRLCAIASVATQRSAENAPYGPECRRVLDEALQICRDYGFITHDDDGYAGHARMGSQQACIGVMTHLDVVPAGQGWETDPFCLNVRDGKAFARGAVDNKGPAAATIFAMHALQACGVPLQRSVCAIFGCNEENGMDDLVHYFSHNPMPLWGFTPDAQYPVINCEKHIFHARMTRSVSDTGLLCQVQAGERFNVVPERAQAVLCCQPDQALCDAIQTYASENGVAVSVDGNCVTVFGRAAHARHPNLGINAAGHMVRLIDACALAGTGDAAQAFSYLARHAGLEWDGAGLGMRCRDEQSGDLTCNFGMLSLQQGRLEACFDMRCPVTIAPQTLQNNFSNAAQAGGFAAETVHFEEGIFVDADCELIQVLLDVYQRQTGREGSVLSIGGGTYARQMPNRAVAFGPCFEDQPDMCHQKDEYIRLEDLTVLCKMIAQALARLAG